MGECFIQNFSQGYENIVCKGGLEISASPSLSLHFVAPSSFSQDENDADLSHSTSPPSTPFLLILWQGSLVGKVNY